MAAIEVLELGSTGWNIDDKGDRRIARQWLVRTDLSDTEPDAIDYVGIAQFSGHPEDSGSIAKSLTAKRHPDELSLGTFLVTIEYDSKPIREGDQGTDPSQGSSETPPEDKPWVIKYSSVNIERPLGPQDFSVPPKNVTNSAGQPFDPTVMCQDSHLVIHISGWKPVAAISPPIKIQAFMNRINSGNWQGYNARTLKVNEFSFTSSFENGAFYWNFELSLEHNPEGWNPVKILDRGTHKFVSNSLPPQPILDRNGNPVAPPGVPLDGEGQPLNAGEDLVFLEFKGYRETDFAGII